VLRQRPTKESRLLGASGGGCERPARGLGRLCWSLEAFCGQKLRKSPFSSRASGPGPSFGIEKAPISISISETGPRPNPAPMGAAGAGARGRGRPRCLALLGAWRLALGAWRLAQGLTSLSLRTWNSFLKKTKEERRGAGGAGGSLEGLSFVLWV
jgi:hypothetical protein